MRLLRLLISVISLLVMQNFAYAASRDLSAEQLFRKFKPAVVKITIRQQQIPIGTGTGFFVGTSGLLATNYHVMKNVLRPGSFSAEFELADGRVLKDFKVSNCRDSRGIDLCLLQLSVRPKASFNVQAYEPSPGETVYAIGHPQGLDFSITNGIISAVRFGPTRIKELQITAAISQGNSGGPIFNARGILVGIVSKFYKEGQNLNFGIHTAELKTFLKNAPRAIALSDYRKKASAALAVTTKKLIKDQIDQAYANFEAGKPVSETPGFKEVTFDFGDQKVRFPIPKFFESCEKMITKKNGTAFQCVAASGTANFSVSRVVGGVDAPLMDLDGKKALKEKPLPIVELLMQEGTWSDYEKMLTANNRKYLYSVPSEAKCRSLSGQRSPDAFFTDGSVQCRFSVYNDLEPDAYSYSIWAQRGKYIYDFYVWMEEAGAADYFNHLPSLAALDARSADPKPEMLALPFSIQTSPSYSLMSTDELNDGTQTFLFSRARGPASTSAPLYMVNVMKSSFAKRDLVKRSRQLFEGTLDGFDTEMQKNSLKFQPITADQMPGFVQTALAQRKEKNVAVFHATLLDERSTYMIFAFGDSSESKQILEDFMNMTLSLKRADLQK